MQVVSIIIPTLNEAENIDILLKRILCVQMPPEIDVEIIFSDGCSRDKTCDRVNSWAQNNPNIHLVKNPENSGLSAAVINAVHSATGAFVVVMDADLSHPPEVLPQLLLPLLENRSDMVIGSRYVKGGETPEWPLSRKIFSILATLPARLLTDVKDPLAGYIAVNRQMFLDMKQEVLGFKFGLELLATGEKTMRVVEIPITFIDRQYGDSKMSVQVIVDYILQLLRLAGIFLLPGSFSQLVTILLPTIVVDTVLLTGSVELGVSPMWAHWWSFLVATVVALSILGKRYRLNIDENSSWRLKKWLFLGSCWVTFLTLCLRSGLLSALLTNGGGLSTFSVFIVSLTGIIVSYIGHAFYVFSIGKKRITGALVHRFYALGVIGYLAVLRLAYSAGVPLLPEEEHYRMMLVKADTVFSMLSLPAPAIAGSVFYKLFEYHVIGLRLTSWLLWFVAAICIFNYSRDVYDRTAGFKAVLIYSVLPFFFGTGVFVTEDALLAMFWCGAVYILYRAIVGFVGNAWIWAGVVLGLGSLSATPVLLLIPSVVIYLLLVRDERKDVLRNTIHGTGAMALTCIPALLFSGSTNYISPYQGEYWISYIFGEPAMGSVFLPVFLLTPAGALAAMYAVKGWFRLDNCIVGSVEKDKQKTRIYLLVMLFIPMLIMCMQGWTDKNSVYISTVVWIAMIPSISLQAADRFDNLSHGVGKILQRTWWPTIVCFVTFYALSLHISGL